MSRDMTGQQFIDAIKRNGMSIGHFGYVQVTPEPRKLMVYARNAGPRFRDQLAYLLAEQRKAQVAV